jgi:tetratricopeptide (TPR) repeat protein
MKLKSTILMLLVVAQLCAQGNQAHLLLEKGRLAYTANEWDSAVRFFTAAYMADSKLDTALYNRGLTYLKQEKYSKASDDFTNFLSTNESDAYAYALRAEAYFGESRIEDAMIDLDKALQLHPSIEWYLMRGQAHLETQNYVSAEADFREVLERDPQSGAAYRGLGDAHFHRGDYIMAQLNYQEAVHLAPYDAFSVLQYGIAQARLGNWPSALSTITDAAVRIDPPLALTTRAYCHFKVGDLAAAQAEADSARNANISYADAYHVLGMVQEQEGKHVEAVALFDECLAIDPEHAEAWYGGGVALYHAQQFDRANTYLNKALEYPAVKGAAAMALANLHLTLGDAHTACKFFQLASGTGYEAHAEENTAVFCKE